MQNIFVKSRGNNTIELSIDDAAFEKFSPIKRTSRVCTPHGFATAVGVDYQNQLWFQIDGESGISYWAGDETFKDLLVKGITLVDQLDTQQTIIKEIQPKPKSPESLKNIIINNIKDNSNLIKKKLPQLGEHTFLTNNFFKTSYDLLKENDITKKDAPKLLKNLKSKVKEERLYATITSEWAQREKQYINAITNLQEEVEQLKLNKLTI